MHWLSAVVIAAVSNVDNLSAGLAFGLRGRRIMIAPNALIAAMTMLGTAGAMSSGRAVGRLLPSGVASALGAAIIIAIGVITLVGWPSRQSALAGHEHTLSWHEALVLGVALSLNNIGSGLGAGIAGVPPVVTTLLAGLLSLLCVGGGSRLGRSLGRLLLPHLTQLVAGVVLVGLGVAMLAGAA